MPYKIGVNKFATLGHDVYFTTYKIVNDTDRLSTHYFIVIFTKIKYISP